MARMRLDNALRSAPLAQFSFCVLPKSSYGMETLAMLEATLSFPDASTLSTI
jgi:hypothetical protein